MLALNAKGDLIADRIQANGTATACLISPRKFFWEALRYGATTALAWHNHPSGDPSLSREDLCLRLIGFIINRFFKPLRSPKSCRVCDNSPEQPWTAAGNP